MAESKQFLPRTYGYLRPLALTAGWLLLPVCGGWAEGQEAAAFRNPGERMVFTSAMGFYVEEGKALSVEEARSLFEAGEFLDCREEWFGLGMMEGTVWLAGTLLNLTQEEHLVLEIRNPRLSYVDLYVATGNGYQEYKSGTARPFDMRPIHHPMPSFPIELKPGAQTTVLLRLENTGDFRLRAWLWAAPAFYDRISTAYYPELIAIGVLLVLAIFHLLVFVSLREAGYLYLCLFITSWMLFFVAGNGIGNMLLWRDMPWFAARANNLFLVLMCATFVIFSKSFLDSRRYTPRLARLAAAFVVLCLADFVFVLCTDLLISLQFNRYLAVGALMLVGVMDLQAMRRGSRMAKLFLASWIFVLASGVLLLLLSWQLVSAQWVIGTQLINILFVTSILLWSFELTGRIKLRVQEQRHL
ncbi:MAG: hypothetical protein HYV26_15445, partial [Candidatus Hydrogenedentes bacterium]|nr:hypothetical protein [Candidatus Hydrogenedentota bacterium]